MTFNFILSIGFVIGGFCVLLSGDYAYGQALIATGIALGAHGRIDRPAKK